MTNGNEPNDFRAEIRDKFSYLFAEYGFGFVERMSEKGGEYEMQIVASSLCQIKFTLEQNFVDVLFGTVAAPRTWGSSDDQGKGWHSYFDLMAFEDSRHPQLALTLPPRAEDAPLGLILARHSTYLKAYLSRFLDAFRPDPGWWAAYRGFRLQQREASLPTIP